MEGISVLNLELPESIKAVTVNKNKSNYCIVLNSFYDEEERYGFLKEELDKIKISKNDN